MARDRKSAARERAKPITAKRWRAAGADWQRIEALCFRIEFRSDGFSDKELGEAGAEIAGALYRLTRASGKPGAGMRQMASVAALVQNAARCAGAKRGLPLRERYLLTLGELSLMVQDRLPQAAGRGRRGFRSGIIAGAIYPEPTEISALAASLQAESPALSSKAAVLEALSRVARHIGPSEQIQRLSYYEKRYSDARKPSR